MRAIAEIEKVIGDAIDEPGKFPGMTYAQGVANALEWVLEEPGCSDPMED